MPETGFSTPEALAQAAFSAHLEGDSRALSALTHPEAAARYYQQALHRLAGWIRLEQIHSAVESGALNPTTISSFRFDANAPVDDTPLYHLRGVRRFRDLSTLDPADFLERAFAAGAEIFGRPPGSADTWRRRERFAFRGPPRLDGSMVRVPYIHTQGHPDGPDTTSDEELIAKLAGGAWWLWFDRDLFTPLSLLLHE